MQRVHLTGIGGVGMSALAQALIDAGMVVTGSDRLLDSGDVTATLQCLLNQGIKLFPQDGSGVTPETSKIVVSTAIEAQNADIMAAGRHGIPVIHRAGQLAQLAAGKRLIAITGTSGKSTVTAVVGWLLQQAGLDPAVVNGAGVVGWGSLNRIGAVRAGNGPWFVIEADESDRSLLMFEPEHAIITNAAADHFNIEETHALFAQFRKLVRGVVIDGTDALSEAAKPAEAQLKGWQGHFVMDGINFEVPIPGRHNIVNAWQAVLLCRTLGVPLRVLSDGLKTFQGVERRLQRVGECNGAIVFDDYGHNPAKLGAAWQTLATGFSRVFAVWRPHGYGPLRKMMDDLVDTFTNVVRENDRLFILPVYDVGGSADRTVNSNQLVEKLVARNVPVSQVGTLENAYVELSALAAPECALVTFGARDPGLPRLAQKLSSDRIQI